MVAWATILLAKAETGVFPGPASSPGLLMLLGIALVGLGVWGRMKFFPGKAYNGSYLALGVRKVNIRGTSFIYEQEESRRNLKRFMFILTIFFVFSISAYAGISALQGNVMTKGGWWWEVDAGWIYMIIVAVLVFCSVFFIMKRN